MACSSCPSSSQGSYLSEKDWLLMSAMSLHVHSKKVSPKASFIYIIQMISNARKMVGQCQGAACFGLMRAALLFVHLTQSRLHGLLQQGLSGLPNESMLTAGKNDLNRFIGCAFLGVNRDENWVDHSNHSAWNASVQIEINPVSRSIQQHRH